MVVDNEFMRSRIEQMREGVERGESICKQRPPPAYLTRGVADDRGG